MTDCITLFVLKIFPPQDGTTTLTKRKSNGHMAVVEVRT